MNYIDFSCVGCKYAYIDTHFDKTETEYEAQIICPNCGEINEVKINIKLVGLPLKED